MTTAHAAIRVSPELRDRIAALARREGRGSYVEEVAFLVKQREEQLWWDDIARGYQRDAEFAHADYARGVQETVELAHTIPTALREEPDWPDDMVINRIPAEQARLEAERS